MNSNGTQQTMIMVGLVVFAIVLGIWSIMRLDARTKECEEKGGTYLRHEGKCVSVQNIPLH